MAEHIYVYSDGGQAGPNPSPIGGAFGFRLVVHALPMRGGFGSGGLYGPPDSDEDRVLQEVALPLIPATLEVSHITNNHVETRALCEAITAVFGLDEQPSAVTFCPDSLYALGLLSKTRKIYEGPPPVLMGLVRTAWETLELLETLGVRVSWELIAGHPEEGVVVDGIKHKGTKEAPRLYRVSGHNKAVDAALKLVSAALPVPLEEEVAARPGTGLFCFGEVDAVTVKTKRK